MKVNVKIFSSLRRSMGNQRISFKKNGTWHDGLQIVVDKASGHVDIKLNIVQQAFLKSRKDGINNYSRLLIANEEHDHRTKFLGKFFLYLVGN